MLARIANSLYWMGRYVERTEHLARYVKDQYFSTLDAPMIEDKQFNLRSIMNMAGIRQENGKPIIEEEMLIKIAFDSDNPLSLKNSVINARENARGGRNVISTDLWEAVNKYYHFLNSYPVDYYKTRGLYDLTINCINYTSIFRSMADSTLIHDEVWAWIRLGIHMERAAQIARILSCKFFDIFKLTQETKNEVIINHQYALTLSVLEGLSNSRRFYKKEPNRKRTFEFLVQNDEFPRSISFNIQQVGYFLHKIKKDKKRPSPALEFKMGKTTSFYRYLLYDDIKEEIEAFSSQTLKEIYEVHDLIDKQYFLVRK